MTCLFVAGAQALQDDEEVPQPARRHRQVSHIMGYEEDWEEAEGVHVAAKTQPPEEAASRRSKQQQQDHAEDEELLTHKQRRLATDSGDDEVAAVPASASVKRKRAVVLEDDDDGPATDQAAEHPISGQAQRDASADMSSDHDAQAELQSPAARLAEEGLDPVEQLDVPQSRRHSRGQQAGAGSIRDRMQQHQQRIREVRSMHCAWQQSVTYHCLVCHKKLYGTRLKGLPAYAANTRGICPDQNAPDHAFTASVAYRS